MEKSKILSRLRLFSKQQMNDFVLFAESPYFNKNTPLVRLLKYLSKYHPKLEGTKVSKPLVYKKIFPEKDTYKRKRLDDLMSHLFKLSEDFLAFDRFKQSPVARTKQELLSYREMGMNNDFSKVAIKLEEVIKTEPANENYHFELFLLNKELFIEQEKDKVKSLNAVFYHLDQYFIQEKLLFAAFAKNREKVYNEEYTINFLELLLSKQAEKEGLSLFFANIREVLLTEDIDDIKNLIGEFKQQQCQLGKRLSYCILIPIQNILMRKYQKIGNTVTPVIFDLYKLAVAKDFISFNGKINGSTFFNVCTFAEKMEARKWQEEFIANYKNEIFPLEDRDNIINLVHTSILFEQAKNSSDLKKIAETIVEMNTLFLTDLRYAYMVRVQLIKLHYSEFSIKKDYDALEYLKNSCQNFEIQLYRDYKTSNPKVELYLNFSKSVKKMATYIFEKNFEKVENLKRELISSDSLFAQQWLIQKVGEITIQ